MVNRQSGNVLIFVLIGVALLAALTVSLSRQQDSDGITGKLDKDKANLQSQELIHYATAARNTIEQMNVMSNVLPTEFSFVAQGETGYGTAPHTAKVFHPAGGGLNTFVPRGPLYASGSAQRGWVYQQGTNVEWSRSSGSDIIFTILDVHPLICAAINKRLYGDDTVPTTTVNVAEIFINGGGDDADFEVSDCASCNGKTAFCIQDTDNNYAFYSVVLSR